MTKFEGNPLFRGSIYRVGVVFDFPALYIRNSER